MQGRQATTHERAAARLRQVGLLCLGGLVASVLLWPALLYARFLDESQTLRFNGRVYNRTALAVENASGNTRLQTPYNAFNMLQNRTFVQVEMRHDLVDLVEGSYEGHLSVLAPLLKPLQWLQLEDISYFMTYRGEYDGVWDYGPDVFSERFPLLSNCGQPSKQKRTSPRQQLKDCSRTNPRRSLRKRHRLFEAYVDLSWEALFLRIGRQNLSWGETDAFRLLDQINPLDASFGGFLVSLDDRRVPLDMVRAVYSFEDVGPFSELNIEGYGAFDKNISSPTPAGSPWSTPNPPGIRSVVKKPAQNFKDTRGGFRVTARVGELTLSAAHYYTFLDAPEVRIVTPRKNPPISLAAFEREYDAGRAAQFIVDHFQANVLYPKIAISGLTASFPIPKWYAIIRSEAAVFWDEPFFKNSGATQLLGPVLSGGQITPGYRQVGIDPATGSPLLAYENDIAHSHVVRWALGLDINRYIRALNPQQSFIISGQMFGTHIVDFNDTSPAKAGPYGFGHFAIPVSEPGNRNQYLVNIDQHQFVNTLSISTSFRSGVIKPQLVFFYDWQGSWLVQPGITLTRDPFRLTIQYNYLDGQYNGIGLLRDRDNLITQLEVVF
ncbi:MAG: hypothetical protein OXC18_17535 [Desulfurellaceae bacterium]|nr:hypothetical protein [Desulfurellaceae bacterium]